LKSKNYNDWAARLRKNVDDIFNHLDTIHERDRRTDRHRRQQVPRLRIASSGNKISFRVCDSDLTRATPARGQTYKDDKSSLITVCIDTLADRREVSLTDKAIFQKSRHARVILCSLLPDRRESDNLNKLQCPLTVSTVRFRKSFYHIAYCLNIISRSYLLYIYMIY